MRTNLLQTFALGAAFSVVSCSGADGVLIDPVGSGGSSPSSGGNSVGGATATGTGTATGGIQASGGNGSGNTGTATGGVQATGGSGSGNTGNTATGGKATGGNGSGNTGNIATGGKATGGSGSGNGGAATGGTATGGAATGGKAATGGAATGGKAATGGAATGGKAATGGASTGGASTGGTGVISTCTEANKTLSGNATGTHCGYTYEYWKDSGTGSQILKPDGFSVTWSGINNLLGRKGLRPGSKTQIVTYEANYQPNGNSYLCIYGWTRNPLIEYYIVDSWGTWKPPGGSTMGTVTCDGGTYDIYRTQRVNQPSIDGNTTFYQYWSVRTAKRTSGTISVGCHFDAWTAKGLNLGSLYEVSMTVEGYQSSGSADVKMSMK